ncbi:hypothetical protein EDD21DRAFT_418711 [Dissophora ornata]|nr:hypothetical protein EDD21DRAFT_418711 [Dissophora ornata]
MIYSMFDPAHKFIVLFDTSSMLITFVTFGRYLENMAKAAELNMTTRSTTSQTSNGDTEKRQRGIHVFLAFGTASAPKSILGRAYGASNVIILGGLATNLKVSWMIDFTVDLCSNNEILLCVP